MNIDLQMINTKVTENTAEFIRKSNADYLENLKKIADDIALHRDKKPIILKIEQDQMELMISSQIGSMKDQLSLKKEGKDLIIGFNPRFLVDALRVIDEEEISIYMINSIAPCIIRDEKNSYLYLILPINVNNSGY